MGRGDVESDGRMMARVMGRVIGDDGECDGV